MPSRIALVGAGPTGLYTLANLIRIDTPLELVLFDKGDLPGAGTPFSIEGANRLMLANIASIEIPPLSKTYLEWLKSCPAGALQQFGIRPDMLDERLFTPRLLLGWYLHDQFLDQLALAETRGHSVTVHRGADVRDVIETDGQFRVVTADEADHGPFDRVIIATGHEFPDDDATRSYFPNPWSGLLEAKIPAASVGIMGTSLSAIDAALAVVCQHGDFKREDDGSLTFHTEEKDLSITMMSRNGILPEADFYCPIPYLPLQVMTEEALEACKGEKSVLDAVFRLFREELAKADPAYAARFRLSTMTADRYPPLYFRERAKADPFRWAKHNLEEVERNRAERITVAWRYAILRMHEKVEELVSFFSDDDRKRFDAGLKRVFVDNYGAVPPESIRRLLALRDAGILKMMRLGDDYEMDVGEKETVITAARKKHRFRIFIDARGQKPMTSEELRFPALRDALLSSRQETPDLDAGFALRRPESHAGRVFFAAIPYLMHDRPFVQGIVASSEIGIAIAAAIAEDVNVSTPETARRCA